MKMHTVLLICTDLEISQNNISIQKNVSGTYRGAGRKRKEVVSYMQYNIILLGILNLGSRFP